MPPKSTRYPTQCLRCGKTFITYPCRAKEGAGKFCSLACAYAARTHSTLAVCDTCGKTFKLSRYRAQNHQRHYCSTECEVNRGAVDLRTRFESHLDKSGECWLWVGASSRRGYGTIRVGGKGVRAHRMAWELQNGPIPNGMQVLHHCDEPACCRVSHLFLGTHQDNMTDMKRKHRARTATDVPKGSAHHAAKLTEADVVRIRDLVSNGMNQDMAAKMFRVSQSMVWRIVHRRAWKHVA